MTSQEAKAEPATVDYSGNLISSRSSYVLSSVITQPKPPSRFFSIRRKSRRSRVRADSSASTSTNTFLLSCGVIKYPSFCSVPFYLLSFHLQPSILLHLILISSNLIANPLYIMLNSSSSSGSSLSLRRFDTIQVPRSAFFIGKFSRASSPSYHPNPFLPKKQNPQSRLKNLIHTFSVHPPPPPLHLHLDFLSRVLVKGKQSQEICQQDHHFRLGLRLRRKM